jgi:hypothetical protein
MTFSGSGIVINLESRSGLSSLSKRHLDVQLNLYLFSRSLLPLQKIKYIWELFELSNN